MKKLLCLPVLALAVLLMGAPNALADTATCSGTAAVPDSPDSLVVGDLDVTGVCKVKDGTRVEGNVKVLGPHGELRISLKEGEAVGVTILGDLQVEPGGSIVMFGGRISSVGGNVQLKGLGSPKVGSDNAVVGTKIGGDLQVEEGTTGTTLLSTNFLPNGTLQVFKNPAPISPAVFVAFNCITNGNLQVFENTALSGGPAVMVVFNQITNGDLQFKENYGLVASFMNGNKECDGS